MTSPTKISRLGRGQVTRQCSTRFFLLLVLATGCAKPVQSGGLGVFHPQGFAGRMALVSRFKGSDLAPAEKPSKGATSPTATAAPAD